MTERLGVEWTATGDKAVVAANKRVGDSLKQTAADGDRATTSTTRLTNAQKRMSKAQRYTNIQRAESVNIMTEVGFSLSSLNDKTRMLGLGLASGGNTAVQLGRNFGIAGIAVGLLSGLIPELIRLFIDSGMAADDTKRTMLDYADALDKTEQSIQKIITAQNTLNGVLKGVGTLAQQQAALAESIATENAALAELEDAARGGFLGLDGLGRSSEETNRIVSMLIGSTLELGDATAELSRHGHIELGEVQGLTAALETFRRAQQRRLELTEANTRALENRVAAEVQAKDDDDPTRRRGGRRRGKQFEEPDAEAALRRMNDIIKARELLEQRGRDELVQQEKDMLEEQSRIALESLQKRLDAEQAMREAALARQISLGNAAKDVEDAQHAKDMDQIRTVMDFGIDAAVSAAEAAITGQDGALKAFLETFATSEGFLALSELAKGVGTALVPGLQGESAGHFASAAMHGAAAALAGGASTLAASAPAPAAGPEQSGGGQQQRDTSGTVVINFNSPVDEAALGRMQSRASRAAERRNGGRA